MTLDTPMELSSSLAGSEIELIRKLTELKAWILLPQPPSVLALTRFPAGLTSSPP